MTLSPDGPNIWRKRRWLLHDGRLNDETLARQYVVFVCVEPSLVLWKGAGRPLLPSWFYGLVSSHVSKRNSPHKYNPAFALTFTSKHKFHIFPDYFHSVKAAVRAIQFRSTLIGQGSMLITLSIQGDFQSLTPLVCAADFWLAWSAPFRQQLLIQRVNTTAFFSDVHSTCNQLQPHYWPDIDFQLESRRTLHAQWYQAFHSNTATCCIINAYCTVTCLSPRLDQLFLLSMFLISHSTIAHVLTWWMQGWIPSFHGRWSLRSNIVPKPCQTARSRPAPLQSVLPFMLLSRKWIPYKGYISSTLFRVWTSRGASARNACSRVFVISCAFLHTSQNNLSGFLQARSAFQWFHFAEVLWYRGFLISADSCSWCVFRMIVFFSSNFWMLTCCWSLSNILFDRRSNYRW